MPISKNIDNLVINKVESKTVYDYMVSNNLINEDELYLIQDAETGGITVDAALSDTSENPVQNKVINAAIDNLNTLVGDTSVSEQINTAVENKADKSAGTYAITTAGNGAAYTATVPGIESLTVGASFIMIPHTVSTTTTPTLDVNGLGAKPIRRRSSNIATNPQVGYTASWLAVNLPFRVIYDGTQWMVEGHAKPAASDLSGIAPKAKADENGNVIIDTYATIAMLQSMLPKVTSITLGTTWNGSASPYYQDISVSSVTETSVVDLQPTPDQLASWQDEGLAFTTLSGDGTVRIYVAGGLPSSAITVQIKIQEVVEV